MSKIRLPQSIGGPWSGFGPSKVFKQFETNHLKNSVAKANKHMGKKMAIVQRPRTFIYANDLLESSSSINKSIFISVYLSI